MKKYALLLVALATTLSLLAQDKYNRYMNVYINGELTYQKAVTEVDSVTFPLLPVEPVATPDIDIPSGTLTVPQANAICSTLGNGETSTAFYAKGWVKEIVQEIDTTIRTFYIAEKMYADSTFGDATFLAYQVHYLKNNSFVDESQLAVGDFVVIYGELTNAKNTYRTVGNGQAYVYSSNNTRIDGNLPYIEPVAGAFVVAVKFTVPPCNDVVWAGNYQNKNGEETYWDASRFEKMQPIEGWEGWYQVTLKTVEYNGLAQAMGKPVQLKSDGTFNWDCQLARYSLELLHGECTLLDENGGQIRVDLINGLSSPVVYFEAGDWQRDPCNVIPAGTGTFTVKLANSCPRVPLSAHVIFTGNFYEKSWGDSDRVMTKVNDSTWTWTGDYPEDFQSKAICVTADGLQHWAEGDNYVFDGENTTYTIEQWSDWYNVEYPTIANIPNIDIPNGTLKVSQACAICANLGNGETTGTKYYVKGWVKQIHNRHAESVNGYGNGQFYLAEDFYSDGTFSDEEFMAYQVYYLNGAKFSSSDQVQVGDYVVIYGELTRYNDIYETVGKGSAYVYATSHEQ